MPKSLSVVIASALAILAFDVSAQDAKPENGHGHRGQAVTNYFNVAVPAHAYDLILARPERNSVTLSALAYQSMDGFVTYGTQPGASTNQTPIRQFKAGVPVEFVITPLQAEHKIFLSISFAAYGRIPIHHQPGVFFPDRAATGQHLLLHHDGGCASG